MNVIAIFFFSKKTSNEYNDGYKRPQTPHDVIYVNYILMLKKKIRKKDIENKFGMNIAVLREGCI